jgi:hypothetical protein
MMDKGNDWIGMFPKVCKNQRWMIELILNEDVQTLRQLETKIIGQMCGVIPPGQRNHLDGIPL